MVRIKKDTIGILGLSKSGLSCAKLYNHLGFKIKGFDDNYNLVIDPSYKDYFSEIFLGKQPNYVIGEVKNYKFLVVSPGVPFDHPLILFARDSNVPVISEISAAYKAINGKRKTIIAITGTNGKSTVSTLIYYFIKEYGIDNVYLAGNIGYPFSEAVYQSLDKDNLIFVLELSSFQLKMTSEFRANIAVLTNISSDHLDRHLTFQDYALSKFKLFEMQLKKDYSVFNLDDSNSVNLLYSFMEKSSSKGDVGSAKAVGSARAIRSAITGFSGSPDVFHISTKNSKMINFHSFYSDDKIIVSRYGKKVYSLSLSDVSNLIFKQDGIYRDNLLSAFLPTFLYFRILRKEELDGSKIIAVLNNFVPLDFRLKSVAKFKNIEFFNDSKATNIASVKSSIDTVRGYFDKMNVKSYGIILLMGGILKYSSKEEAYKEIEELSLYVRDKVLGVIGFGRYADVFTSPFARFGTKYVYCSGSLDEAFGKAVNLASSEEGNFDKIAILLAPGGASFDEFKSAEERGKFFDKLVENFMENLKTKIVWKNTF